MSIIQNKIPTIIFMKKILDKILIKKKLKIYRKVNLIKKVMDFLDQNLTYSKK